MNGGPHTQSTSSSRPSHARLSLEARRYLGVVCAGLVALLVHFYNFNGVHRRGSPKPHTTIGLPYDGTVQVGRWMGGRWDC